MKTIIAGSRGVTDLAVVAEAVRLSGFTVTHTVSGCARGVDTLGEHWSKSQGIPVIRMPANWDLYGKSAGYKRNEQMACIATALIAIWDGKSKGTKHMIDIATKYKLVVYIHRTDTVAK